MKHTQKIPLFPLGLVLFPDGVIALKIFETRYLDMIKQCLRDETEFGVVSVTKNEISGADKSTVSFSDIGTLASIEEFDPVQPALFMTKSIGTRRFRLISSEQEESGLWVGEVEFLEKDPLMPIPKEHQRFADLLSEIIKVALDQDSFGVATFKEPFLTNDCGWVANRFAELLPISLAQKNHLLAQTNPRIRLDLVTEIIEDNNLRNYQMQ